MEPDGRLEFDADYDPAVAVRLQQLGSRDPCLALEARGFWRSANTPAGPVCVRVRSNGSKIFAESWGEGTAWALERLPAVCGALDTPWSDHVEPEWLNALVQQHSRLRLGRALRLPDLLWCVILQQRVRGAQAADNWSKLVHRLAARAPGPSPLWLPPTGDALRRLRLSEYAALGIDAKRARTLRECALHVAKLDRVAEGSLDDAREFLPKLRGIGPWTTALLLACGLGDPDAVQVGDYHLPNHVAYAFTRRRRATDEEMLELLEPYRGNRHRVVRLIEAYGPRRPRGGPRLTPTAP